MNEQTSNKIREIMAATFNVNKNTINTDSTQETIETWDSLKHMNLIITLEDEFNIRFDEDEIVQMLSFEIIYQKVMAKISK